MLSVEQELTARYPGFFSHKPALISRSLLRLLRILFHEREVNRFLEENRGLRGLDFIERVLDRFDLDYTLSSKEIENIPPSGRVVIVANHPLGALDALALILMVSRIRKDIRVVANELLSSIEPLSDLLLPVDNLGGNSPKSNIKKIHEALHGEHAVIVFPAGEVSRLSPGGIRDVSWKQGFLKFSKSTGSPVLPVYIDARNSTAFYAVSMVYKPLAALLLVREMFLQQDNTLGFRIGELIPVENLGGKGIRNKALTRMLRKHLYRVGQGKQGLFATESSIAHPEPRQALRSELARGQMLGETRDGKQIILMQWQPESSVMREIGRLRELSFRKVGEGTGRRRDTDRYDQYYRHLVLWDDSALEMVGAYRLGDAATIMKEQGISGLYTASLFQFDKRLDPYLQAALELGRSFVQPSYWGSRALDYLWQGLGAYLNHHPGIRYLFGPVSISASYPRLARDLLVCFYRHHFGDDTGLARSNAPYRLGTEGLAECRQVVQHGDYQRDFLELKNRLAQFNLTVPTLYKQYTELCHTEGVRFLDFGIDPDFTDCTDGLILVDLETVKPAKRKRYMPTQ